MSLILTMPRTHIQAIRTAAPASHIAYLDILYISKYISDIYWYTFLLVLKSFVLLFTSSTEHLKNIPEHRRTKKNCGRSSLDRNVSKLKLWKKETFAYLQYKRNSIWSGCGFFLVEIKQEINFSPSPSYKARHFHLWCQKLDICRFVCHQSLISLIQFIGRRIFPDRYRKQI